jgi:hypothetical protein
LVPAARVAITTSDLAADFGVDEGAGDLAQ